MQGSEVGRSWAFFEKVKNTYVAEGSHSKSEAGNEARSHSIWDLHILLEEIVWKKKFRIWKYSKGQIWEWSNIGLEGRDLGQGRRSQELYWSHISWTSCPLYLLIAHHERIPVVLGPIIIHGAHSRGWVALPGPFYPHGLQSLCPTLPFSQSLRMIPTEVHACFY